MATIEEKSSSGNVLTITRPLPSRQPSTNSFDHLSTIEDVDSAHSLIPTRTSHSEKSAIMTQTSPFTDSRQDIVETTSYQNDLEQGLTGTTHGSGQAIRKKASGGADPWPCPRELKSRRKEAKRRKACCSCWGGLGKKQKLSIKVVSGLLIVAAIILIIVIVLHSSYYLLDASLDVRNPVNATSAKLPQPSSGTLSPAYKHLTLIPTSTLKYLGIRSSRLAPHRIRIRHVALFSSALRSSLECGSFGFYVACGRTLKWSLTSINLRLNPCSRETVTWRGTSQQRQHQRTTKENSKASTILIFPSKEGIGVLAAESPLSHYAERTYFDIWIRYKCSALARRTCEQKHTLRHRLRFGCEPGGRTSIRHFKKLLFIAHSLGGIVVKEALQHTQGCQVHQNHLHNIFESTCGVFFFGTPHDGADPPGLIHHVAEKTIKVVGFSVNEQIVNTLLPSSQRLRELREEFAPMARQRNWIIYCFQEQYGIKALHGSKVVDDMTSCLSDPGIEIAQHIASNHMDMCRFHGLNDVEYQKVAGALERIQKCILKKPLLGLNVVYSAEQRQNFMESLKFDQINTHEATIKKAHSKTCEWILSKPGYKDWLDFNKVAENHGFLWIKGKPGTGKSTIMKFAHGNAKRTLTDIIVISFFFNAHGENLEKSTCGMYRSLLFQLLAKLPELQNLFDIALPNASIAGDYYNWDIETVKDLFGCAIESLGQRRLTCFMDALDE
ncbi:hypothetical protein G7Y89_g5651 [Cudoniella acicularis]|uniref:Nephrocystin 3-like N-terminal domain-containing protein n=1 Tax=Cudoniella acicularis TaxID=354080 RepID=A0A8H4W6A4_9HELO|nr:hypothetical protein G7Y89_g5651 [Cudoniella acicularis]